MKTYAEIYKAIGDETRITILALLIFKKELCVCDVEGILEISQSKASRHLRYLKNAGLITDRREGIWVYYRITADKQSEGFQVLNSNKKLLVSLLDEHIQQSVDNWFVSKQCNSCAAG
ncbi:MAG: winged helix-turn-helix transcriptional regulator [Deltaproteobacteria bacterium]|nr:winged helix-turn-helix transcriptional regulator [Deltaproteobacteria bacterium]